jgi:hypothetical protein
MVYRVAQWNTGIVGAQAAKAVIGHPEMELVACFAHSPEKVGIDAGVLAGAEPIGVLATNDIDQIIAARPDCVLYMPLYWDVEAMARLLEAGVNVISTANFITGASYGEDARARLNAAALRGGASLYGVGINPGHANALGLMATAVCRKVRRVSVLESVDATNYSSAETWRSLGFGLAPETPGLAERVRERALVFLDAAEMMADALKVETDEIVFKAEFGSATQDLALGYMDIAKGMVCGVKMTWSAMSAGRSVIELGMMWRLGYAMTPDWIPEDGYIIEVDGEPNVRCAYRVSGDPSGGGLATGMPAFYAIPAVCAARPGIVTAAELPLVVAAYAVSPD